MINGVININKGKGCSSFHVVAVLRHFTGEKKIGHTGTLDPDATGVLPVCIGKATKLVGRLTDTDKRYKAVMLLGKRTDTQDITGNVIEEMPDEEVRRSFSPDILQDAFRSLNGEIHQVPPMYSALKVGGVKLVDAARKGREIERSARKVTVYGYSDIEIDNDLMEVSFTIDCSKGTYVRTICEDIGKFMGIPACLSSLVRTRTAGLTIEDSVTLEKAIEAAEAGTLENLIIPTDRFLQEYGYIVVKDEAVKRLIYGNTMYDEDISEDTDAVSIPGQKAVSGQKCICRVYDRQGEFYALYRSEPEEGCYKCEKMFK
ncbi:MAG: tRNA pseudouridine(55) synthase TruB [Lachnospiraceae bacterium]|nr:tRNA pseudouridine(55) synthase TruB [Lachnospiraceae bacterium]